MLPVLSKGAGEYVEQWGSVESTAEWCVRKKCNAGATSEADFRKWRNQRYAAAFTFPHMITIVRTSGNGMPSSLLCHKAVGALSSCSSAITCMQQDVSSLRPQMQQLCRRESFCGASSRCRRRAKAGGSVPLAHTRTAALQQQQVQQQGQKQLQATGRVYLATCPLVGWEPFADTLGERFPSALHLHRFVIVEQLPGPPSASSDRSTSGSSSNHGSMGGSSGNTAGSSRVVAYDFLPLDATSPATAAVLLSGGSVHGGCRQ